MQNNIHKGNIGETMAVEHLIKNGYSVLDVNWRFKHLEIDIIASINKTLVIVEVKLRSGNTFGNPEEFVTKSKQKNLVKAADAYIKGKNSDWETRFDIISIIQNPSELSINHITEAFYPRL